MTAPLESLIPKSRTPSRALTADVVEAVVRVRTLLRRRREHRESLARTSVVTQAAVHKRAIATAEHELVEAWDALEAVLDDS